MDFFVNKIGWESSLIARKPVLVSLSLEKRIVPRWAAYEVLLSKGLIKNNNNSFINMLVSTEKCFLKKFVNCHEEEAPELLKLNVLAARVNLYRIGIIGILSESLSNKSQPLWKEMFNYSQNYPSMGWDEFHGLSHLSEPPAATPVYVPQGGSNHKWEPPLEGLCKFNRDVAVKKGLS
ncbi:hypothetical protein ACSBR2_031291 [Camellia fascicularis]